MSKFGKIQNKSGKTSTHRVENIFPKYLLYNVHEIARKCPREKKRYSSFSNSAVPFLMSSTWWCTVSAGLPERSSFNHNCSLPISASALWFLLCVWGCTRQSYTVYGKYLDRLLFRSGEACWPSATEKSSLYRGSWQKYISPRTLNFSQIHHQTHS